MPRKKKSGPTKGGPNKSAFIRSQPATMKASEVVKAGKARGLAFSEGLVYAVRSAGKAKKAKSKPGRPKGSTNGAKRGVNVLGLVRFAEVVSEVGGIAVAQRYLAALKTLGT